MSEKNEKSRRARKPTVSGIIVPEKWDNNGNVVGVSIQTFDENEYLVKNYKQGKTLLSLVNKTVSVIGKVSERLDGKMIIQVNRFDVINDFIDKI